MIVNVSRIDVHRIFKTLTHSESVIPNFFTNCSNFKEEIFNILIIISTSALIFHFLEKLNFFIKQIIKCIN